MSVATVVLVAGTLTTSGIVNSQDTFASWGLIATGVVPFFVFMVAGTAELNRPPFDLVEAEQELVGGFHTEYSSIRFALFYLAEFMNTVTMSAIIVTLFLGGPRPLFDIPIIPPVPESILWFLGKLLIFLFVYVWFRATLPRFRYDQLMDLGWKVLIPLAFGWFLLITALRLANDDGWNRFLVAGHRHRGRVGRATACSSSPSGPALAAPRAGRGDLLMGLFKGFLVTLRQIHKPVTTPYSGGISRDSKDVKIPKPERLHGRHVLNRYEDGMEKCIGCELCAGVCPARCIYVRGADNPPDDPVSPGERYGYVYEINFLRCIHCDLCVEACPTEAITETKLFEFSFTNRRDAIYTKAELLVGDDGRPQHLPWEDWRDGDDEHTSGLDAGHGAVRRRLVRGPRGLVG